jgi:hypothetical protein
MQGEKGASIAQQNSQGSLAWDPLGRGRRQSVYAVSLPRPRLWDRTPARTRGLLRRHLESGHPPCLTSVNMRTEKIKRGE